MALTIVVGGQYGSEGKGKVALDFAKRFDANIAVKVGGMNSGHTAYKNNKKFILKTLPTPVLKEDVTAVIPSGAYFEIDNLFKEKDLVGLSDERLLIDPLAVIITKDDIDSEKNGDLIESIGSTGSGTGAAVANRVLRNNSTKFAKDFEELKPYITDTKIYFRDSINKKYHIIVEGTQGFGLSLLHSEKYPFVTSRDTTAASILSEIGLSPFDVTDIILTIRAFPIRVSGNSGELENEITWEEVKVISGSDKDITEYTSVTNKVRRIGKFDAELVKKAIMVNNPSILVLNHLDYIDSNIYSQQNISEKAKNFIDVVEKTIDRKIDYFGSDPYGCYERK